MHPISPTQLMETVKLLKNKSSFGEDYLSNKLLKVAIPYLLTPLTALVNMSITTGYVPEQIKLAKIIPLFKEGDAQEFTNYRPIAIISSVGKLIEKIVHIKLTNYLESDNLLHPNQFGFRAAHSVIHPLLLFSQKILDSTDSDMFNLTIFVDLKKAFDTVNINILLQKLFYYGIENVELLWFENYLKRKQFTKISGNTRSSILKMILGLPQGSILGPLLFLVFINDLPYASLFFSLLFADDCTFQMEGASLEELFSKANTELNKTQELFASNLLTINIKKTKFMVFHNNKTILPSYPPLTIGTSIISRAGSGLSEKAIRFLGLWVDNDLTFYQHISKIKMKLGLAIYQLSACKYLTPEQVKKNIYYSIFESNLRFAAPIYGSAKESELNCIFLQQKRAVRLITNAKFKDHTDPIFYKLRILKLPDLLNLERIIIAHKFKHRRLPNAFPTNFLLSIDHNDLGRRGDISGFVYRNPPTKMTIRHPINMIISSWNSLDPYLKTIGNIKDFKKTFTDSVIESYNIECSVKNCFSCSYAPSN